MTAPTTTLAAQILAALDEEERVAGQAENVCPTPWGPSESPWLSASGHVEDAEGVAVAMCAPVFQAHIARQDPAATLRRVEKLREVVTRLVGMAEFDRLMDRESIGAREALVALAGALGVEG